MASNLSIQFELPMLKASTFIGYLRKQLPNYIIFVTDFTGQDIKADDMFSKYDKTKPQISMVIRNCDILNKKCFIEISHNPDTVKILEGMGYTDEKKAKLFYVKEWD